MTSAFSLLVYKRPVFVKQGERACVCVFVIREKRMIYFIYTDGEKKKNKKNNDDRQRNRYNGKRETRGKRLFLLYDLETEESVVFMIDQH
jgi:hypothetical protein